MAQKEWVQSEDATRLDEPKLYNVIMWNDDYTTMEFVVEILMDLFDKSYDEAVEIMLSIHKNGKEICGKYTFEIAETKINQAQRRARTQEFPLRLSLEKE